MSDASTLVQRFFQKKQKKPEQEQQVVPHNSFRSLFDVNEENVVETQGLKASLESAMFEDASDETVHQDITQLLQLSTELKAIGKQAVLLVGERVSKAKEILKHYGKGKIAFSSWLDVTFVSRKTAYNALNYFEFYHSLPDESLKKAFKQMPMKASYILASREGEMETKLQLIEDHCTKKQDEIIGHIRQELPPRKEDARSKGDFIDHLLNQLHKQVISLDRISVRLNLDHKVRIQELVRMLNDMS